MLVEGQAPVRGLQRHARLMEKLRLQPGHLLRRDIRRVGHDDIKAARRAFLLPAQNIRLHHTQRTAAGRIVGAQIGQCVR